GPAAIGDGVFELRLSSNLTHLVVYTPVDKPYFCVEPVSHVSDAIHGDPPAALGLRTLQPGEPFEASMTLEVTAL
ncbi:MAG: aldose 1-epimerase, partial [Burkholderiaceae bacterium]|nr:aldose 1-epimerase [Burkholderiaceae bacterium]